VRHSPLLRATVVVFVIAILRGILPAGEPGWLTAQPFAGGLVAFGLVGAWRHRREPEDARLERDPAAWVLVAVFGVLLAILLSHRFRLTSDGIDHYVYLRSLAVDHDLDFANDYALVSPRGEAVEAETPLGRAGNVHPVGPAVVWAPFYLVADVMCRIMGRPTDGLGEPYKNAVAIAGLLYGWVGLVLLHRTAAPRAGRGSALLATLGLAFGTFLYWYLAYAPTMAHAPAFAAAALVIWLWLGPLPQGPRRAALLGAACGLAALLRWPNGLLALLPVLECLKHLRRREEWRRLALEGAAFALAALVVFSPQILVWRLLYGSFVTIPQGAGFLVAPPAWDGVLFSPHHGLFSWSPFLYLGAVGLLIWLRREPWRALAALVLFLGVTRVNAGVADWWGGSAFGGRRFDAALPLFGLGAALALSSAAVLVRRHPWVPAFAVVGAFTLWNLLLAGQYRSGAWDYAGPVAFEDMGHGAVSRLERTMGSPFSLPGSLWAWLRTGRPPTDYESLYMRRPHSRFLLWLGQDDRMFLEDGWSEPRLLAGASCRLLTQASAGLVVPLHRPAPYRLGARVMVGTGPADGGAGFRLRVLLNQRPIGVWTVEGTWQDRTVEVPAEVLQPGRNHVRFRALGEGAASVAVAAVWLEPGGEEVQP